MDEKKLDDLMEKFATSIIAFHEDVQKHVQELSEKELAFLVQKLFDHAKSTPTRNFPIPVWEDIARQVKYEHDMRIMAKQAAEYMKETGETVYCPFCKGKCTPEHLAGLS